MFNYVEFLGEYAPYDNRDLENICIAADLYNLGVVIKLDFFNRAHLAQKALAAGMEGILFTDHRTADDVRESMRMIRPTSPDMDGMFGFPSRRFAFNGQGYAPVPDYMNMLRQTVVMIMIERKEAVDNLEEILSIPGVDMIQWGPTDYALSRGWDPREKQNELKEIELSVIKTAQKMGIHPRCEILYAEDAKYYKELGVKHFCIGDEIGNNIRYYQSEGKKLKKIIEE
jgi:2-keto-3-deoxy-L-rhamnonate aldolase RhmA